MSDSQLVLCEDGNQRTLHGVHGSYFVYANGRRVYGYTAQGFSALRFHASTTSKYRHLVAAPALVNA